MTASPFPRQLAAFRGPVSCHRGVHAMTLTGAAGDSGEERLILTFVVPVSPEFPETLAAPTVVALDEHRYRITSLAEDCVVEAAWVHVHRDIRAAFYRAIPPRPAPLTKRLFWRAVLALARSAAGRRLLICARRR